MLVAWRHSVAWVWWTKWRWVSVPGWMLVGMRSLQIWCSCYLEVSGDSWGLRAGWHLVRYPSLSLLPSWPARTPQSPTFSVWFGTVSGTASSKSTCSSLLLTPEGAWPGWRSCAFLGNQSRSTVCFPCRSFHSSQTQHDGGVCLPGGGPGRIHCRHWREREFVC